MEAAPLGGLWFTLFILIVLTWRGRKEIADGWRQRSVLPPRLYWGVAGLYALSGAIFSFATFGATHLRIPVDYEFLQFVAMAGVISWGLLLWIARKLANPWLLAGNVSQAGRNHLHGVWGAFLPLGVGFGFLPLLFPSPA